MKIEFTEEPHLKDVNFLTEGINHETKSFGTATPFAFFIRNKNSEIIAGANGFVLYGKIYTDQLYVTPRSRNQGLAQEIMDKVHEYGIKKDCIMATVSTFSFQNSVDFYRKIGYEIEFERKGHIQDSSCFFMKRDL